MNILTTIRTFIARLRSRPVDESQPEDDTMTVEDDQSSAIEALCDAESDRRFLEFVSGSLVDILQSTCTACSQGGSCLPQLESDLALLVSLMVVRRGSQQ